VEEDKSSRTRVQIRFNMVVRSGHENMKMNHCSGEVEVIRSPKFEGKDNKSIQQGGI